MRTKMAIYRQKIADMVTEEMIPVRISQSFRCYVCGKLHVLSEPEESALVIDHHSWFSAAFKPSTEDCAWWNFAVPFLYDAVVKILKQRGVFITGNENFALWAILHTQIIKIWKAELWDSINQYKVEFDSRSEVFCWLRAFDRAPHFTAARMIFGRNETESRHIVSNLYSIPEKVKQSSGSWYYPPLRYNAKFDKKDNVIIEVRGIYGIEPPWYLNNIDVPVCKFNITANDAKIQLTDMTCSIFKEEYKKLKHPD
jgi:hypothetical protein